MSERSSKRGPQSRPASKTVRKDGTYVSARYSLAIAREICERVAQGEAWHRMANTGRLPSYTQLYAWMRRYPEFAEAYAQAREMKADLRADKVVTAAEESTPATASSDRIKVGAYQWAAARGAPKKYGSRADDRDEEETPRLIIEVRRFEKFTGDDGRVYVREIPRAKGGRVRGR